MNNRFLNFVLTSLLVFGIVAVVVGVVANWKGHDAPKRLVCFDGTGAYKLSLKEYNLRFVGNRVRAYNNGNDYLFVVPQGWICSITDDVVKASK